MHGILTQDNEQTMTEGLNTQDEETKWRDYMETNKMTMEKVISTIGIHNKG